MPVLLRGKPPPKYHCMYLLALSLLDRGCCSSTCCCCCCCCCGRCSSTRRWWSTGSHPTESLVEQDCVSSGYWLCVSWAESSCPTESRREKTNEKPTINVKKSRQRMHMHLLVRDNTWAGPSNPRGSPRDCRAGRYIVRVPWALLPCDGPGRAGTFENDLVRVTSIY